MPRIPVGVGHLPLYLKHDFISFGERFVRECLHCSAIFDMPSAADERCRRHEDWQSWAGNPFRPDGTH
jgi:hypothetical protein